AVTLFDGYVKERELRSWQRVEGLARKNLAYAAGALGQGIAELVGVRIDDDPSRLFGATRLERIRAAVPEGPAGIPAAKRLEEILAADQVASFVQNLEVLKQEHREFLAQWLPAMVSSGRHAELLERHAVLNDLIAYLQRPFRPGLQPEFDDWRATATGRMDEVLMRAAELHEFTLRAVRDQKSDWKSPRRKALSPSALATLRGLDEGRPHAIAPDFVPPWP